jgi:tetratricopeptide (TPR) repeat protein
MKRRINPCYVFACIAVGLLLAACVPPQPYPERTGHEEYRGPEYFFREGMEDFRKGEYKEAIEDFQHAVQMRQNYVEAYFYMGQAFEKIRRPEQADKAYEKAIFFDPRYLPAREALGQLEYDLREYKEAEKHLEAAKDLGSTNPNVFYVLGKIELSEKECRKAIQAFKEALRLDPGFHEAREGLERAEDRCGRAPGQKSRTEKSFKGGGKAISPEDF